MTKRNFESADIFGEKRARLEFFGAAHFRQRLICATLAHRSIVISDIRINQLEIGLKGLFLLLF
jgi:RNA 3'-terminal phosphate cyclase